MHDESMTDENRQRAATEAIDTRVVNALEMRPAVDVPLDFASRVAARVPVKQVALRPAGGYRVARYGRRAILMSMVLLVVAMVAVAPRVMVNSALWVGLEWIMCSEFLLLALWFVMRREELG